MSRVKFWSLISVILCLSVYMFYLGMNFAVLSRACRKSCLPNVGNYNANTYQCVCDLTKVVK